MEQSSVAFADASMDAGGGAAHLTTRPLRWDAGLRRLFVNYNGTSELRAEVRDAATGAAIESFSLGRCVGVRGDTTRAEIAWRGAPDGLDVVAARPIQLHFEWRTGSFYCERATTALVLPRCH